MPSLANTLRRCHSTAQGGQEELHADLGIGAPVPGEPGDLLLLRRELAVRFHVAPVHRLPGGELPGGEQLTAGALGERFHAHRVQHLVRGPQLHPGVFPAALTPQPFAVEKVGAGQFRPQPGTPQPLDRLAVKTFGCLALADQGGLGIEGFLQADGRLSPPVTRA